jgi:hypothetical protein
MFGKKLSIVDGLQKSLNYNLQQQQQQRQSIIIFVRTSVDDLYINFPFIDRKRRRVDNDDSVSLLKLVRFCSTCHQSLSSKQTKKKQEIIPNPTGFIDPTQATDLLSCYL